jgi:biotin operon repressor
MTKTTSRAPSATRAARAAAPPPDAPVGVQALNQGLLVLSLLRSRGPLSSEDLGRELEVSKRQINRYLIVLRARGYVEPEAERRGIYLIHHATHQE